MPCVGTRGARKGPAVAGVRPGRACQEVPWHSPEAGGLSLGSFLFLAENGVLRNGTEEVVSLEQCPPSKRLKTYPCNNGKVEEDQTRGNQQRELGSGLGWVTESTGEPFWERAWLFPGTISLASEGKSFCGPVVLTCALQDMSKSNCKTWAGPHSCLSLEHDHVLLH